MGLLCPGKNTGVGCHFLLHLTPIAIHKVLSQLFHSYFCSYFIAISQSNGTCLYSHQAMDEFLFAHMLSNSWFSSLFNSANLISVSWYLIVVSICIPLNMVEIEPFIRCWLFSLFPKWPVCFVFECQQCLRTSLTPGAVPAFQNSNHLKCKFHWCLKNLLSFQSVVYY